MEEIITVVRIQPPAPGKKQAAIYDANDQRWGLYPDDLSSFTVGGQYKVWDWQTNNFQGRSYRTIKSGNYMYLGMGGVVPPQAQARQAGPQRTYAPQQRAPFPAGADDVVRRRDIFVCGALNNLLSNPSLPIKVDGDGLPDGKTLVTLIWRLRRVFDYTLGPGASDPSVSTAPVGREATPAQQADAALGYGRVDGEPIPNVGRGKDMDGDEIPF